MTRKKTRIEIYDTTLRDGTQSQGVSLSVEDKLMVVEVLDGLGVDIIEGGYPLSSPKDAAFFDRMRARKLRNARLAAFGMTRRKSLSADQDEGMRTLLASGAPIVAIVGKSWDMHVREVLAVSEDENLAMISESVGLMVRNALECVYDAEHFFDGWRANPQFALRTLRAAVEAGACRLVLCDTNGGTMPEAIAAGVDAVRAALPDVSLGIHCHNDCDLAIANSLAAVLHGCTQVQGTINGMGERCGNADLTTVIPNLTIKYGFDCLRPGSLKKLTEASRYVYEIANLNFRDSQPFVGASAFAHKGGMHVHAVRKAAESYEHIDPGQVGNARRALVSELSGISNIAATAPAKFGIADDKAAQRKVLKALMDLEHEGYQFEAAEASFEMLIRKTMGGKWYSRFWQLDHYRCIILKQNGNESAIEATVKLLIDGKPAHQVAEGDGPVDSLKQALCLALRARYAHIDDLHLTDYKVRVVNTAAGTAAKVRVLIDWHDVRTAKQFGSVGVSTNIIDASWLAIADAFEYKLLMEMERV
ncbi:MAG: citramalate synthase [Planctomycetes bacterium]|nr:citramalate synthase [Planctomycetota bacterium]